MTGFELALGLARGIHVAATMSLLGAMAFRATIAPPGSTDDAMSLVARRITSLIRGSLAVAIVAAAAWLLLEARDVAGADDSIRSTVPIVMLEMRFGWLLAVRLVLLVAAVALFDRGSSPGRRIAATLLAGGAVGLQAGLGHGASMADSMGWGLAAVEALHLLAAGAWLGGLIPLYFAVGTLAPQSALNATRRFSRLGVVCVTVLGGTILIQGWELIGGLPGLIGTEYGRVAALKIVMLVALLAFAAANRLRHAPQLAGTRPEDGRRRLRQSIAAETAVGLCVILAAGVLLTLPPAMHEQPDWPFPYQFSLATQIDPDLRNETLLGATQAIGAFAFLCFALVLRRARWIMIALAAMLAWWAAPHLSLLLVPAYPTSFYHSTSGFTAASIANGAALFAHNCTICHGAEGRGDGPQAKDLRIPPADLTAPHLFAHSDGEMFWWLTHGIEGPDGTLAMPGFGDQLGADERWNLIDYLRAHNAGLAMAQSGQWPHAILAPDMIVPTESGNVALSGLRGQVVRIVATYPSPSPVPAGDPAVMTIPLTSGSDAWAAYAIAAGTTPEQLAGAMFLIDRDGWLRAVLRPDDGSAWPSPDSVAAAIKDAQMHRVAAGDDATTMHHHH